MGLIVGWVSLAGAVLVAGAVVPGIDVDWSPGAYLVIAAVFAVVNLALGQLLRFVSMPFVVLTLGLFSLVVNAVLFLFTDWLVGSLRVDDFWAALGGATVIAIVAALLQAIAGPVRRARTPAI